MNRMLYGLAGLFLTAAMVILGMAWGRYVSKGTHVDTTQALWMIVLVGALIVWPAFGLLRSRPRR